MRQQPATVRAGVAYLCRGKQGPAAGVFGGLLAVGSRHWPFSRNRDLRSAAASVVLPGGARSKRGRVVELWRRLASHWLYHVVHDQRQPRINEYQYLAYAAAS